jgi:anaerobic selenocysteine-containing dehydrogenase
MTETYFGACPHDCPDTCAMLYEVDDGRLARVRGNPDHPVTRGGLCVKVKDFEKHHYNPDRVLHPLKRIGPKGEARFERIGWDEALAEIRRHWTAIIGEWGAEAILPCSYLGNMGTLQGLNVGDAFFNRLGATVGERTFCASGVTTAYLMTLGPTSGVDPESFIHSRYIVLWACNSVSTNLHHWHIIQEARRRHGARIVVIDPYRSRTAKLADWHIAPRPGSDAALAMGMINALAQQGLVDQDYVARHTLGYAALAARAAEFTPDYVEDATGVPGEDVWRLAREFAGTQPSVIRVGVAIERNRRGGQAARAVFSIPALTGSWRHVGGGAFQAPVFSMPIAAPAISRPEWIRPGTRVVNVLKLGAALSGGLALDPPIKSLMVYNANPAVMAPRSDLIAEGLRREDLFTVVSEHFITDTAAYADIVLPATMAAEQDDLMWSWGHLYVTLNQKAIEAPGEAVPNTELFRRLARVMGFDEEQFRRTDEEMMGVYFDWSAPQLRGIDLDLLRRQGFARLEVAAPADARPHAEGNFPTPSGKCEFLSTLAAGGDFVLPMMRQMYEAMQEGAPVDPLPGYSPSAAPPEEARYPLGIISPKSHAFLNSTYANEDAKLKVQGGPSVVLHPLDARARGIEHGAEVRVFNEYGAFRARAVVSDDTLCGVVVAPSGNWRGRRGNGGSVNNVCADRFCDLGHGLSANGNRVDVERAAA